MKSLFGKSLLNEQLNNLDYANSWIDKPRLEFLLDDDTCIWGHSPTGILFNERGVWYVVFYCTALKKSSPDVDLHIDQWYIIFSDYYWPMPIEGII